MNYFDAAFVNHLRRPCTNKRVWVGMVILLNTLTQAASLGHFNLNRNIQCRQVQLLPPSPLALFSDSYMNTAKSPRSTVIIELPSFKTISRVSRKVLFIFHRQRPT